MDGTLPLLLLLLAALALALLGWWRAATRVGRHNARRQRVATRGESEAEALVAAHGFTVLDRQVRATWTLWVDGEAAEVSCRADLLLKRGGARWVAEVKTGAVAPDPTHPATRRQLLEYLHVFDVQGALLVDMDAGVVREVAFEAPRS